ncbi:MAG: response regulator [Thermoanaerobaculia bacterium]
MPEHPEPSTRSARILVVEDSPTQREQLRFLLEESGFEVVTAVDGEDALAAAGARDIEVVISDVVMPRMDGFAFCKALRDDPALRHLPVILLTSLGNPSDVIKGLESGANNFICKPYDDRALVARVRNILANQELRVAASSEMGISIFFAGQQFFVTADRLQILDLLLSTYETAVENNSELITARDTLRVLNERLEAEVAERTGALTAEIEERKRVEEDLRASKYLLEGIIDSIPARVFWKDRELVYLGCNTQFANDAGEACPGDVIGKSDHELAWRELADGYRADDLEVIESGCPRVLYEEPLITAAGDRLTLLTNKAPLRDNEGRVIGILGTYTDITARKEAEKSRAMLATAVEQAAESIVITDVSGSILYVNPAFERATGYTREEAIGQTPRLLKSGKQTPEFYRNMWEVLGRGEVWSDHFVNRRRNGTLFEEEATISPVRNEAGEIVSYVAVKRDITREVELKDQLTQSQKMDAVGRLAGGVAHDFNNILGIISGYAEIVHNGLGERDPLKERVEQILRAAERAAGLTRQLLAFGRRQVLQPKILELNSVVSEMDKMLRRLIGEDIELTTQLEPRLGAVKADAGQIEQILMNLVVNSRDAMADGGRITVETRNVELAEGGAAAASPGQYVMVAVSDTGEGMDAATQAQIFEPFFTTKPIGKGTGLGLSTVYGIVQQSGGFIRVASEPGRGTTFSVYFPRVDQAVDLEQKELAGALKRGVETVLLVEDEEMLREMLREGLEGSGYTVLEAGDGPAALQIAERHPAPIELLLTDMLMPGMTGQRVAKLVTESRPGIKVLYMSGYSDESVLGNGLTGERSGFLSKPFGIETLLRKIRVLLDTV